MNKEGYLVEDVCGDVGTNDVSGESELKYVGREVWRQRRVLVEKVSKLKLTDRDISVLAEIYFGQLVPLWVIDKIYFEGRRPYRGKRMGMIKRYGLLGTVLYFKKHKRVGGLYYLTGQGINTFETLTNRRERLSKARPPVFTADDKEKYWEIAMLRMLAFDYDRKWLYGKQFREKTYMRHNLHIDGQLDDCCIHMIREHPSRYVLGHLKYSISKLAELVSVEHLIICDKRERLNIMQYLCLSVDEDDMHETLIGNRQDVWVMSIDEGLEYLENRFKGNDPYTDMIEMMKGYGFEVAEAEKETDITPHIVRHGNEQYYLADFTNYNISELIRVLMYRSEMHAKYGWPAGVLVQVSDIRQLKDIAMLIKSSIKPRGHIKYMLKEPYKGCVMFSIDEGEIIERR